MTSLSSDELANVPLKRGIGYDKESVNNWRQLALNALQELESQLSHARTQLASRTVDFTAPTAEDIAATLSPDELKHAGLVAVGLALTEGIETSSRRKQEAEAQVREVLNTIFQRIKAADQVLAQSTHPEAVEVRRTLRQALAALRGERLVRPAQGTEL